MYNNIMFTAEFIHSIMYSWRWVYEIVAQDGCVAQNG